VVHDDAWWMTSALGSGGVDITLSQSSACTGTACPILSVCMVVTESQCDVKTTPLLFYFSIV
jgi:hypothetical protein